MPPPQGDEPSLHPGQSMRDVDAMIAALRQAAETPEGRILAPLTSDGIETHHQVELLVDCGLAEWVSDDIARVTNAGYDFLEGLARKEDFREQLQRNLDRGIPIVSAIAKVMQLLTEG